jgi:hypothetical protein
MGKIDEIVRSALHEAAFIGYDKDDEFSQESFDELVNETVKKIKKAIS